MIIKEAKFSGSFIREEDCPKEVLPEYAFIGRSNVGKSSLINMLTNQAKLAKVSNTPGKTQTINYFKINDAWYLVDLPGFGYARQSKDKRADWGRMINYFLLHRTQLQCVFVLVDGMIPPQKIDIEFINFLGENELHFVIAFTKTDRLSAPRITENISKFKEALGNHWSELPSMFLTSAEKGWGKEDVLKFISESNVDFKSEV